MISLEQIKLLEKKVESALQKIVELQNLNSKLENENSDLQTEVELLKEHCSRFEQDEAKIEQGIISVLNRLNSIEDAVRQEDVAIPNQQNPIEQPADTEESAQTQTAGNEPAMQPINDNSHHSFQSHTGILTPDETASLTEPSSQLDIF
ncbi:MAG: cell division protein ZapB [Spirochaetales bacterium]